MTVKAYVVVYHIGDSKSKTKLYDFYGINNSYNSAANYFYDVSDDPSFLASNHFNSELTWGVCRRNVRHLIKPSDVVIFIGVNKSKTINYYNYIGYATVKEKISQLDIWLNSKYSRFQNYCNIVLRKDINGNIVHDEKVGKHKDWLWRICDSKSSSIFKLASSINNLSIDLKIGKNYIIFDKSKSSILYNSPPICIAEYDKTTKKINIIEKQLYNKLLGNKDIVSSNPQNPHTHTSISLKDYSSFLKELSKLTDHKY